MGKNDCYTGTWGYDAYTRPRRCRSTIYPKWRLRKKWFNRYGKSHYIGRIVTLGTIVDVHIRKNGSHRCKLYYNVK
jgi:hypothetical protein